MFHRSKAAVLVSLVTAWMAILSPRTMMARGGGRAGGHSGSGAHAVGEPRPGGFGRDSSAHGYAGGFTNDRGTGWNFVSGSRGRGSGLTRAAIAPPAGHWKRFDNAKRFSKGTPFEQLGPFCRECFVILFGGNFRYWEFYDSWWSQEPWWYADVAYDDYWNPYYSVPDIYAGYNYAFPIPFNAQGPQDDAGFADARQDFYDGCYIQALADINRALRDMPNNPDVHAFYALIGLALGDYKRAAAVAHTLLEAGPGWDWATLQSFYPSPDVYTTHLQALEHYVGEHGADPAPRFLLAYQYLMLGHRTAASHQLAKVVALQPRDTLAAAVLAAIRRGSDAWFKTTAKAHSGTTAPNPAGPTVALKHLTGTWKATPKPDVTIETTLAPDDHFVWTATEGGQTRSLSGTYALDNNRLVFTRADGNRMHGVITSKGSEAFQLRLKDTAPRERELQFSK